MDYSSSKKVNVLSKLEINKSSEMLIKMFEVFILELTLEKLLLFIRAEDHVLLVLQTIVP
jgi:hypothetical protein